MLIRVFFISNLTSCRAKIPDVEARAKAVTLSPQEVIEFRFPKTVEFETKLT